MLGELDEATATALRGVEVAQSAGAEMCVMACHTVLSHIARERGCYAEAQEHLEQSEALAEKLGLSEDVMVANTNLGELALATGDLDQARRRWERTLAFYGGHDQENTTFARLGLGAVAHRQGQLDEAAAHFAAALELAQASGFWHNATMALIGLAGVAAEVGDHDDAAVLLGRASGLLQATGGDLTQADQAVYDQAMATASAALGDERMRELLDAGAGQTPDRAIGR
jgi:tetratricopeptide (TPR) repeat protein